MASLNSSNAGIILWLLTPHCSRICPSSRLLIPWKALALHNCVGNFGTPCSRWNFSQSSCASGFASSAIFFAHSRSSRHSSRSLLLSTSMHSFNSVPECPNSFPIVMSLSNFILTCLLRATQGVPKSGNGRDHTMLCCTDN